MTTTTTPELRNARRAVNNFRAMVRRPSNWAGALEGGYSNAVRALLNLEDSGAGTDVTGPLSDRLMALRHEAGMSPDSVINAERRAVERADHDREIAAKRAANR